VQLPGLLLLHAGLPSCTASWSPAPLLNYCEAPLHQHQQRQQQQQEQEQQSAAFSFLVVRVAFCVLA
jgi:hypothetical protein